MDRSAGIRFDRLAWSAAAWTGIAVLIAIHRYVTGWLGPPGRFLPALLDNLHYIVIWALATPLILRSVEVFPISGERWLRNAVRHAVFGTVFLLVLNLAGELWNRMLGPSPLDPVAVVAGGTHNFLVLFPFALSIYGAVVGIGHVIRSRNGEDTGAATGPSAREESAPAMDAGGNDDRLPITEQYRTHLIDVSDITHIEADGHHVVIHTPDRSYRPRMRFSEVLRRVAGSGIVRIHRSHAVRAEAVAEVQTYLYGDCMVILHDGTRLRMSRTYRDAAEPVLGLGGD